MTLRGLEIIAMSNDVEMPGQDQHHCHQGRHQHSSSSMFSELVRLGDALLALTSFILSNDSDDKDDGGAIVMLPLVLEVVAAASAPVQLQSCIKSSGTHTMHMLKHHVCRHDSECSLYRCLRLESMWLPLVVLSCCT